MSDELNQAAQDWAALWKRRAKLTKWQRDATSAQVGIISERSMQANSEIERLQAQLEELKNELELWKRRANAQVEITRAAMDIVNAPFQIYDGRTGQRGYRISTNEFESLAKAVKQYMNAANEEQHHGTNTNEASG